MQITETTLTPTGTLRAKAALIFSVVIASWLLHPFAIAEDAPIASPELSLVGLAQIDGISYASLVDNQTQTHFLLSTADRDPSLRLAAITESGDAVIEENGQSILLRMGVQEAEASSSVPPAFADAAQNIQHPGQTAGTVPLPPPGASLPLVFRAIDPNKVKLTDEQQAIIDRLRQNFLAALNQPAAGYGEAGSTSASVTYSTAAGAQPSPSASDFQDSTGSSIDSSNHASANSNSQDPAQTQTWQNAQNQSDDMLRMLFGVQTFNLYEMGLVPLPQRA